MINGMKDYSASLTLYRELRADKLDQIRHWRALNRILTTQYREEMILAMRLDLVDLRDNFAPAIQCALRYTPTPRQLAKEWRANPERRPAIEAQIVGRDAEFRRARDGSLIARITPAEREHINGASVQLDRAGLRNPLITWRW